MTSSRKNKKVLVFGGTGFLGSAVLDQLVQNGYENYVITHNNKLKKSKNIIPIKGDAAKPESYKSIFEKHSFEAVIYLIGIIREKKEVSFKDAHYNWAKDVLGQALAYKTKRFIYLSAEGVEKELTDYQIYKSKFEKQLEKAAITYQIFRPPVILGDDNATYNFVNVIKGLFLFRVVPVFGFGRFPFSYIGRVNLAERIVDSLEEENSIIRSPQGIQTSYIEFLKRMSILLDKKVIFIPLPMFAFKLMVALFGWLPFFPLTKDQLKMLTDK